MFWTKKINTKTYLIGSLTNIIAAIILGWPDLRSMTWLIVVLVGAIINHYSSIYVVSTLIQSKMSDINAPLSKGKMAFFFLLKIASLIVAFALLANFARELVPQGIIIYIFQLIILALSIKNIGHLTKKGPLK